MATHLVTKRSDLGGGFRGPEAFQGVRGGRGYILTKFGLKLTHQTLVHTIFHDFGAFFRCFSCIPVWEWDQWTGPRAWDQWTSVRLRRVAHIFFDVEHTHTLPVWTLGARLGGTYKSESSPVIMRSQPCELL